MLFNMKFCSEVFACVLVMVRMDNRSPFPAQNRNTVINIKLGSRSGMSSITALMYMFHDSNHNVGKGPFVCKQTHLLSSQPRVTVT